MTELKLPSGYDLFLKDLKERVRTAQLRASLAVNRELVLLYWSIGRDILARQKEQGWGAKIVDRLAEDLRREFPEVTGFSPRNLKYMRAFAEAWPDEQIVQAPLAQITWYHNIALIEKLTETQEKLWYAQQTIQNGGTNSRFKRRGQRAIQDSGFRRRAERAIQDSRGEKKDDAKLKT
jgi:predicted nuclease of restriction endonuclease-like (RecB) superfamily